MQFLARATAFLFGLGVAGAALAALALQRPGAWMPLALGAVVSLLISYSRWTPKGTFTFLYCLTWISGGLFLWVLSSAPRVPRFGQNLFTASFAVASFAAFLLVFVPFWLNGKDRKSAGWLLLVLTLGMAVVFMSGPPGQMDSLRTLLARYGLEEATLFVRKAGHFTFYGVLAWASARAALAQGVRKIDAVAFAFPLAFATACFDELRQSTHVMRVGSPWDVLIDMAGAIVFLTFTKATKGVRSK